MSEKLPTRGLDSCSGFSGRATRKPETTRMGSDLTVRYVLLGVRLSSVLSHRITAHLDSMSVVN